MWQLVINGPGYFDTVYDLADGPTTLGRAEENDIVLSGDLVSRRHGRLLVQGDTCTFEDLASRNGSRVNASRVEGTVALEHGDAILIGENTLSLRRPSAQESAPTELVDLGESGIRRVGGGADVASSVLLAKDVRESVVLRVLDNVLPFDSHEGPPVAEIPAHPPIAYESLWVLYQVAERLNAAPTLKSFLEETVDRVLPRLQATTAVVMLRHSTGVLVPAAVRHRGRLQQGEVPVSDAIVEAALRQGAALAVADVPTDARFAGRESVILYGADQVLCVPIGEHSPFEGVLYVNFAQSSGAELEPLLDFCTAVAHLVAAGLAKFKLRQKESGSAPKSELQGVLERHLPPPVVERRFAELAQVERPLLLEGHQATVLAVELPELTAWASQFPPAQVAEVLGELYRVATAVVFSFGGTVSRFSDGGLLALFGAPYESGDDGLKAVRAALSLRLEWKKLMGRGSRQELVLRQGLSSGPLLAGFTGWDSHWVHAALGEPVELAVRLAGVASRGQVLITQKTLAVVGARFDVEPLGERDLLPYRGVSVFQVVEEDVGVSTQPEIGQLR